MIHDFKMYRYFGWSLFNSIYYSARNKLTGTMASMDIVDGSIHFGPRIK